MADEQGILTFFTTHAALRAEKVLREAGVAVKVIPVPRHLSAECTVAVAFSGSLADRVRGILSGSGIETSGIYALDSESGSLGE
jgi:hypothetical protein